jgi:hypothetical protein
MMIQALNPVSSPDQAGLKTLDKPGFFTPSYASAAGRDDTARPDASGITQTTTLPRSVGVLACEFQHRLGARNTPHNSDLFGVRWQAKRDTAFGTPVPTGSHYTKRTQRPPSLLPDGTISTLSHPSSLRSRHPAAPTRSTTISTVARGIFASFCRDSLPLPTPENCLKIPVMSRIVA